MSHSWRTCSVAGACSSSHATMAVIDWLVAARWSTRALSCSRFCDCCRSFDWSITRRTICSRCSGNVNPDCSQHRLMARISPGENLSTEHASMKCRSSSSFAHSAANTCCVWIVPPAGARCGRTAPGHPGWATPRRVARQTTHRNGCHSRGPASPVVARLRRRLPCRCRPTRSRSARHPTRCTGPPARRSCSASGGAGAATRTLLRNTFK